MKVLVIGGGRREHALVWMLAQSRRVEKIWCAPGNGGTAAEAECIGAEVGGVDALAAVAERLGPDLNVVGPELPLVNGIGDAFRARGWPIVAPSQQAAQLEGSKICAKEFLVRHGIPTARRIGAYDSASKACDVLRAATWPLVIKADGLCAGKGVFLAPDAASAKDFIERVLEKGELGLGGRRILLEETLEGEELSFILITDGERYAPLVPTRDYKRVFDGNRGPNTGGMGAYSTDELLPPKLRGTILESIVEPTIPGLAADGIRYQGFLYIGLMLTQSGPKVLELNCRLGDPETQAIAARMDFDLAEVLAEAAAGRLDPSKLRWKPGASVCIVLSSCGYPGKFETGKRIEGLASAEKIRAVNVFHAGTKRDADSIVTSGGRVLGVTAAAASLCAAFAAAYETAGKSHLVGLDHPSDHPGDP